MILLIHNIYMYLHLSQYCVSHYHYIIFILTLLHAHHSASFLTNTRVRFHYLTAVIMKNWNICPMTNISIRKRVLFLKPTVHLRCFFFLGQSLETPHWYIYDLSWPSEWVIFPVMEVLQIIGLSTLSINIPGLCLHLAFDWWSLHLINNWQQSQMNVVLIIMWNSPTAIHLGCIVNTLSRDSMSTIFALDLSRPFSWVPV